MMVAVGPRVTAGLALGDLCQEERRLIPRAAHTGQPESAPEVEVDTPGPDRLPVDDSASDDADGGADALARVRLLWRHSLDSGGSVRGVGHGAIWRQEAADLLRMAVEPLTGTDTVAVAALRYPSW